MGSPIAQTVSAITFHSWKDKKTQTKMWIDKLQSAMMAWTKASRWRKSAKWKRLIKQFQSHLIVQRNRRKSIIRQSSADIAHLLKTDMFQKALDRVKQLYKDKCLLVAYDQMEHFCGCIATNLPLIISKQSTLEELPSDVSEAVSSIVFAASRCGELPELNLMRNLLRKRFGCKFEEANVKLFKENLVNPKMRQNLCIGSIPDDVKLNLIKEIAEEHNLQLGFQDLEQNISPQCQKVYRLSEIKFKSRQEVGVSNMEILQSLNGNDVNKIQTSPYQVYWLSDVKFKSRQETEVSDMETQESLNGNDVNKIQTLPHQVYRLHDANFKSGQEAEVPNMEILDSLNGNDDKKIRTSAHKASEKKAPKCSTLNNVDYRTIPGNSQTVRDSTNGSSSCNQVKKNEVQMEKVEAFSSALSSTPKAVAEPRQCHSLPRSNPWSQDKSKVLVKDRRSFDSSVEKLKERSLVHPKLPDYEEVVAKLTELKVQHKQRQSLSNSKAFR